MNTHKFDDEALPEAPAALDGTRNHGDVVTDVFDMLDLYGLKIPEDDLAALVSANEAMGWVREEFLELKEALEQNDIEAIKAECVDVIWVALNVMRQICKGEKSEALRYFRAIYLANLSKTCQTEEEAKATINLYHSGTHPHKPDTVVQSYYRQNQGRFVICRRDGKTLKGVNFKHYKNFL